MAGHREEPAPAELRIEEDGSLFLEWSDGHQSRLRPPLVRRMCPCAMCRETREAAHAGGDAAGSAAGSRSEAQPSDDPSLSRYRIRKLERVGRYAVSLVWGDGHNTGIYSWTGLRELCDCFLCRMEREEP